MTEYPILFSGPLVRAILAGTKTVTRRVVKEREFGRSDTPGYDWTFRDRRALWNDLDHDDMMRRCPYGEPGHRLWVRETWGVFDAESDPQAVAIAYRADDHDGQRGECTWLEVPDDYAGRVPGPDERWRPSIHMPRWACRIELDVLSVGVERVQDITAEGARAEGIDGNSNPGDFCMGREGNGYVSAFARLWDSINGKRPGCAWADNPWVWRIEFSRRVAADA